MLRTAYSNTQKEDAYGYKKAHLTEGKRPVLDVLQSMRGAKVSPLQTRCPAWQDMQLQARFGTAT
jgi:hypothetical protein